MFHPDATVSVPAMIDVDEGNGMVQVCAMLTTSENITRPFSIILATRDGTGKDNRKLGWQDRNY